MPEKAKKIRLFPEYRSAQRKAQLVDYEDRELVELLTQFSRTSEHAVTPVFWAKNVAVMEWIVSLMAEFRCALVAALVDKAS